MRRCEFRLIRFARLARVSLGGPEDEQVGRHQCLRTEFEAALADDDPVAFSLGDALDDGVCHEYTNDSHRSRASSIVLTRSSDVSLSPPRNSPRRCYVPHSSPATLDSPVTYLMRH